MNKKFNQLMLVVMACALFSTSRLYACNNSNLTLDSVRTVAGQNHVYLTLCIGAGRTGTTMGADGPTGTFFAFAVFGGPGVRTATSTLTPSVTSDFMGTTYVGDTVGPGYGIGEVQNIVYYDPDFMDYYTCVSSTAGCGNVHSDCKQFHFVFNGVMPDSIRALGIEGAAPYGGCYGLNDMVVSFSAPCSMVADAGVNQSVPLGGCANLNATQSGGTGPFTYLWSNGASTASISVCPAATTTYTVTVTDVTGCADADQVQVNVFDCNIWTLNAGADRTVYYGYSPQACTTIGAVLTGGYAAPPSYSWSNGATTPSINVCPTTTTNYTVTVTDANGCVKTDAVLVTVVDVRCGSGMNKVLVCRNATTKCINSSQVPSHLASGWVLGACSNKMSENMMVSAELTLSPNPASEMARILFSTPDDGLASIRLYDLKGAVIAEVFQGNITAGNTTEIEISLSAIPAGIYLVRMETSGGSRLTERLVVTH